MGMTLETLRPYPLYSLRDDHSPKPIKDLEGYQLSNTIEKDGNCQFRALSKLINRSQAEHQMVRAEVVNFMRQNVELKNYFIEAFMSPKGGHLEMEKSDQEWESYLGKLGAIGTWGDEFTLLASAIYYKVRWVVVSITKNSIMARIYGADDSLPHFETTLGLCLLENHY